MTQDADAFVRELREQITAVDHSLVEGINRRLELVERLKRYKEANGIAFVDPGRERWLLDHLRAENAGPLSPEGLASFHAAILDLTKREVGS